MRFTSLERYRGKIERILESNFIEKCKFSFVVIAYIIVHERDALLFYNFLLARVLL